MSEMSPWNGLQGARVWINIIITIENWKEKKTLQAKNGMKNKWRMGTSWMDSAGNVTIAFKCNKKRGKTTKGRRLSDGWNKKYRRFERTELIAKHNQVLIISLMKGGYNNIVITFVCRSFLDVMHQISIYLIQRQKRYFWYFVRAAWSNRCFLSILIGTGRRYLNNWLTNHFQT